MNRTPWLEIQNAEKERGIGELQTTRAMVRVRANQGGGKKPSGGGTGQNRADPMRLSPAFFDRSTGSGQS